MNIINLMSPDHIRFLQPPMQASIAELASTAATDVRDAWSIS